MDKGAIIKERSEAIRMEALRLGFDDCGFSRSEELPGDRERLKGWLDEGRHGRMGYMANHFEKRTDPTLLVEGSQSVISLLFNYYTDKRQQDPAAPVLSKYAYGIDYHHVMKDKMQLLFDFISDRFAPVEGRMFVDSAPVLDRAWARKAGLGWIGKNSHLISRKAGSFVFIGELIINLELAYNEIPENDFCGSCSRCIEACPTAAILDNRTLDANKCISYLTIELKDEIPAEFLNRLENRFFGCDICQDVCPWNHKVHPHKEPRLEPAQGLMDMTQEDWQNMDRDTFNRLFRNSAVKRAGFEKTRKNISLLRKKNKDS